MGGMDLIFTLVLVRHFLDPPSLCRPMTSSSWTHSSVQLEGITCLRFPTCPDHPHLPPAHPPTFLYMQSRVNNGEESIELPYRPSKMIAQSPMASVVTPVKGVSKQDCIAPTEGKSAERLYREIYGW